MLRGRPLRVKPGAGPWPRRGALLGARMGAGLFPGPKGELAEECSAEPGLCVWPCAWPDLLCWLGRAALGWAAWPRCWE